MKNKQKIVDWLKLPKVYTTIILVLTIIALAIFVTKDGLVQGGDLEFHINRIYEISENLKSGDVLSLTYSKTEGYGSGIFYPQIFLYIPAILNLCGIDLIVSYKIFLIICNLVTALVMYICIKSITGKRVVGIIASALYTTCNYRMLCLIARAAIGEVQAFIFIPVVILGLYEVFYRDIKKWYILAIGMTGLIYTHLISAVLAVVALCLPVFIINIKKIFIKDKSRLKVLINAVILTVLLISAFLLPFLEQIVGYDFYLNNNTVKTNVAASVNGIIENIFSIKFKNSEDDFLPGVGLIIVIFSFAYLILKKGKEQEQYDDFYKILLISVTKALYNKSPISS